MQIIKEKIKFTGVDTNIRINLDSNIDFLGTQQEINNLTGNVSNNLINPVIDGEKRRFRYNPTIGNNLYINFYFKNTFGFNGAGFTDNELLNKTSNVTNSFFILDYYDTYDVNNQRKIFTTYLTKIGINSQYILGYDNITKKYTTYQQFYYWYVPLWYINLQTENKVIGYVKLSFYNAKSGATTLFYNNKNASNSLLKMYFEMELDLNNCYWKPVSKSNTLNAYELMTSNRYSEKYNNTISKINNIMQMYPTGSTFNYESGKYI